MDLLEEHLVNQPLLGCFILFLFFLTAVSLIFAIVFVACRALGHCGSKRYQVSFHISGVDSEGDNTIIHILSLSTCILPISYFISLVRCEPLYRFTGVVLVPVYCRCQVLFCRSACHFLLSLSYWPLNLSPSYSVPISQSPSNFYFPPIIFPSFFDSKDGMSIDH